MEEKTKIAIVSGIDIFVAVMLLFIGIMVILLGLSYNDYIQATYQTSGSGLSYTNPFRWLEKTPWIILFIGLATIIYSIKRLVDDLSKLA